MLAMRELVVLLLLLLTSALALTGELQAQDSVDTLPEQARSQGRYIEKLKNAPVEEPDPMVRLAAFDVIPAMWVCRRGWRPD